MSHQEFDDTFLPVAEGISHSRRAQPLDLRRQEIPSIRLAGFEPHSLVAGPGARSVVWVAGCHRRCPGCSQPEYLSFKFGRNVSVDELWERVRVIPDIDGVTFSGGEPFEQARGLGALARRVRHAGLSVVSYSGYRLEALMAEPSRFGPLLDEVDLLIDGEFRAELMGNHRWRGSSNQRLLCLTDRIKLPPEEAMSEMQITVHGHVAGFSLSGIWPPGVMQELIRELRQRGFSMEPDVSTLDEEKKVGGP